ncbi:hypothetical protein KDX27_42195 [Burkholderia cenocepacia]|uniref:hypothetical protein n=1 Tax=Burkholderia cepacia complex TaxID=87882 RepID=UPI001BA18450|nr:MULTISPECIES: hypothetical protein [Burkholderia cepacia complex]MBR8030375.1 hypothetical protein [Burkholderia cenocepacia]MBR8174276.1 hypothetical protein [Burkholderia cenocepacia]MBU9633640.1 hypothetical protein [Burkholderia multivorans]MBU9633650.1 hypothetical protein [Burkholderia multivorans]
MAERALILSADAWEMADERTGEIRKGVSFWYVSNYREDDVKSAGFKPTKLSGTFEAFDQVRTGGLPALCDIDFATRPGKDNKATLTLVAAKHVSKVDLFAKGAKA